MHVCVLMCMTIPVPLPLHMMGWGGVACVDTSAYTKNPKSAWCSSSVIHLGFWDSLSLCLELADCAKSACQQATGILLSLPPQYWDYKSAAPCPAFLFLTWILGIKFRCSALDSKHSEYLPAFHSPLRQLLVFFDNPSIQLFISCVNPK